MRDRPPVQALVLNVCGLGFHHTTPGCSTDKVHNSTPAAAVSWCSQPCATLPCNKPNLIWSSPSTKNARAFVIATSCARLSDNLQHITTRKHSIAQQGPPSCHHHGQLSVAIVGASGSCYQKIHKRCTPECCNACQAPNTEFGCTRIGRLLGCCVCKPLCWYH